MDPSILRASYLLLTSERVLLAQWIVAVYVSLLNEPVERFNRGVKDDELGNTTCTCAHRYVCEYALNYTGSVWFRRSYL